MPALSILSRLTPTPMHTHFAGSAALAITLLTSCATNSGAVIDREVEFVTAMHAKDLAALEQIMAPDFRLTGKEIPPFALTADAVAEGPSP